MIGTVAEVFTIARRGLGVLFTASPDHIATRDTLAIVVTRPDGTSASFAAHRELARTARSPTGEVVALAVSGATPQDIPAGSVIAEATPDAMAVIAGTKSL
ncbi:hypothetical protein [Tahibacter sp.]|uniref:hypothetical protein n=1 Tax=Tahibacter sp. TaxID=2056211 RepID=UPI0028C49A3C|nr:hypothetical protein [Tahibacter sp.]